MMKIGPLDDVLRPDSITGLYFEVTKQKEV